MGSLRQSWTRIELQLKWAVTFALLLSLVTVMRDVIGMQENEAVVWLQSIAAQITLFMYWAFMVPLVIFCMEQMQLRDLSRAETIIGHVLLYSALGTVFVIYVGVMNVYIWPYWEVKKVWEVVKPKSFFAIFFNSALKYYVAVLLGAFVYLYALRVREEEIKASRLSQQLSESRLHLLRMQLHPHFLFNALHSISTLVYKDAAAADTVITELSELLRMSLDSTQQHVVPLQEELKYVTKYLKIEQVRFSDRLKVEFDVDPQTTSLSVPNLILQPLVENALKHGIGRSSEGGRVRISAYPVIGGLVLAVEDNGAGPARPQNPRGMGVNNVRMRLVQLYGLRARLVLKKLEPQGTRQELFIPVESETEPATHALGTPVRAIV